MSEAVKSSKVTFIEAAGAVSCESLIEEWKNPDFGVSYDPILGMRYNRNEVAERIIPVAHFEVDGKSKYVPYTNFFNGADPVKSGYEFLAEHKDEVEKAKEGYSPKGPKVFLDENWCEIS